VAISYTGTAPPAGSRLNFIVTAGNVPCEGTEASTTLYYVHADHLNTPRALVDVQNRVVWRWDSDPFGVAPASEDPDGDGKAVTLNLRFPGQYRDAETGLHYNYFRDYDPQTGRYVQSDPIGLAGGINPYGYASANPLGRTDPMGLFDETGVAATAAAIAAVPAAAAAGVPVIVTGTAVAAVVTTVGVMAQIVPKLKLPPPAANDPCDPDDECKVRQIRLKSRYEGILAIQAKGYTVVRGVMLWYNRDAVIHNISCPKYQVPTFNLGPTGLVK
jgi:RHS repeat-associated protein